jgi:hypothetical protein
MTKEEIIKQFQGTSEETPTVYIFTGNINQLKDIVKFSYNTLAVNGVIYFSLLETNKEVLDQRVEVL